MNVHNKKMCAEDFDLFVSDILTKHNLGDYFYFINDGNDFTVEDDGAVFIEHFWIRAVTGEQTEYEAIKLAIKEIIHSWGANVEIVAIDITIPSELFEA